jgi:hypothetical protein
MNIYISDIYKDQGNCIMKNKIIGILALLILTLSAWIGTHSFAQAPQNVATDQDIRGCGQGRGMGPCGHGRGRHFGENDSNNQIPIKKDTRQFVKIPEMTRQIIRQRMLNNLIALNQIFGLLANDKLNEAADVAEKEIGNWRIGHGTGMGPGKFMPIGMRQIGMSLHKSVEEFARIARKGDTKKAYAALQNVSGVCVACHLSYRTR